MGTVAAAETEETDGTVCRAVAETEEAAVAEIAEAVGDMVADTEPAAAGDRRGREALRDARVLKDREVHRVFRDLTERQERQGRWARWVRQEQRERQARWARWVRQEQLERQARWARWVRQEQLERQVRWAR